MTVFASSGCTAAGKSNLLHVANYGEGAGGVVDVWGRVGQVVCDQCPRGARFLGGSAHSLLLRRSAIVNLRATYALTQDCLDTMSTTFA